MKILRTAHVVAASAFLIAALWSSRGVLGGPATRVTLEGLRSNGEPLLESDLRRNIAQIAYVSRALSTDPLNLFDGQMCYPTSDSVSFGEHMLGEGLLGLPAYLLWNDPVVTFNFVATARPLIGAVSMYALAYYWTGSFGAALIAGFLFGFHPTRLRDLLHPSVVGNEWIPAILLSLHLLFTRRRWRDAVVLSVLVSLQTLESLYVLLQFALVVGIYGAYLLWRHRRAVRGLLPKLALVAGSLTVVGIWMFGPYLETRAAWGILEGRTAMTLPTEAFWIGGRFYPGSCLLLLASLGLLDRLRGARTDHGYDPRVLVALIGLVVLWFVFPWRVPGTYLVVPSLRELLLPWLPGLNAVRAPDNVFFATAVSLGLLAAYGVRVLGERLGPKRRAVLVTLVATACVVEVFVPAMAKRSFGRPAPSKTFRVRPPAEDLAAVRDLPPGPVLDFPLRYDGWSGILRTRQVLLGAYHGRRQATCQASFKTPAQYEVAAIAQRLPNPSAARELWALGFRTIIFHNQKNGWIRHTTNRIVNALADPSAGPHLIPVREGEDILVCRLMDDGAVTTDLGALSPAKGPPLNRSVGDVGLRFLLRSQRATFRHPDPIQPTDLIVTWTQGAAVVRSQVVRGLLPLALAAGRTTEVTVDANVPETAGKFDVTLAPADRPQLILAKARVVVKK